MQWKVTRPGALAGKPPVVDILPGQPVPPMAAEPAKLNSPSTRPVYSKPLQIAETGPETAWTGQEWDSGRGAGLPDPPEGPIRGKPFLSQGNGTSALDREQQAPGSRSHCCPAQRHHSTVRPQVRMALGTWGAGWQDPYGRAWWFPKRRPCIPHLRATWAVKLGVFLGPAPGIKPPGVSLGVCCYPGPQVMGVSLKQEPPT